MDMNSLMDGLFSNDSEKGKTCRSAMALAVLGHMETEALEAMFKENVKLGDFALEKSPEIFRMMGVETDDIVDPGRREEHRFLMDVLTLLLMEVDVGGSLAFLLLMRRFVMPMAKRERAMEKMVMALGKTPEDADGK